MFPCSMANIQSASITIKCAGVSSEVSSRPKPYGRYTLPSDQMIWTIPFAAMGLIGIGLLSAIEGARVNILSGMMSAFEPHQSMKGIQKNHHWRIE